MSGRPAGDCLPPVCILAGGLGTRLGPVTQSLPKALVEVAGEPFVLHQLRLLADEGAGDVVLCVGHLGELVEARLGRRRFGLSIAYSYDAPGLDGTLGAIRRALPLLGERFLYLYGDTYLRLDYRAAERAWRASGLPALMTVLENGGRWGASNASFEAGLVTAYDKMQPGAGMRFVDYGLGGLAREALDAVGPDEGELAVLHSRLARCGLLCGYRAEQRFYEIGSPEALAETDAFLQATIGGRGAASDRRAAGR